MGAHEIIIYIILTRLRPRLRLKEKNDRDSGYFSGYNSRSSSMEKHSRSKTESSKLATTLEETVRKAFPTPCHEYMCTEQLENSDVSDCLSEKGFVHLKNWFQDDVLRRASSFASRNGSTDSDSYKDGILIHFENKNDLLVNTNKEILQKNGFKEDSYALETILGRSLFLANHIEPTEVVQNFVVDEFKYNSDLASDYESAEPAKWKVEQKKPQAFSVFSVPCKIIEGSIVEIDVSEDGPANKVLIHVDALRHDSEHQYVVLFHGTDIQSAYDISAGGIAVSTGSHKRDFSDGKGFYLTNEFERAKKWAFSITQKPAVLIYALPNNVFDTAKKLNLSGESKQKEWEDIVSANRSGILDWKMRKKLGEYECIEGPISVAEADSIENSGETTVNRKALPNSYQMCVINRNFASKVSKCLSLIAVYNIEKQ